MATTDTDYEYFARFAQDFTAAHPCTDVPGDYYDQPGVIVYRQATRKLPEGGRIEVNTTTPEATAFSWAVEVTINDKQTDCFIHFLLQCNHEVVETYGKTIIPVDAGRAAEISAVLAELVS